MAKPIEFQFSIFEGGNLFTAVVASEIHFETRDIGSVLDGPKLAPLSIEIFRLGAKSSLPIAKGDSVKVLGTLWAKKKQIGSWPKLEKDGFSGWKLRLETFITGTATSVTEEEIVVHVEPIIGSGGKTIDPHLKLVANHGSQDTLVASLRLLDDVQEFVIKRGVFSSGRIGLKAELHPIVLAGSLRRASDNKQIPIDDVPGMVFRTDLSLKAGPAIDGEDKPLLGTTPLKRSMRLPVSDATFSMVLVPDGKKKKLTDPPKKVPPGSGKLRKLPKRPAKRQG